MLIYALKELPFASKMIDFHFSGVLSPALTPGNMEVMRIQHVLQVNH